MAALSKALHGNKIFVQKLSGTAELTTTNAFLSTVNSGVSARQWKMKELLFVRSTSGSIDFRLKLKEKATGKVFILKEVLATTLSCVRIAANLVDGEYYVDSDAEILVETSGIGGGETWSLRMTGQLVG